MTELLLISTNPLLFHAIPFKLMAIPSFQLPKPKVWVIFALFFLLPICKLPKTNKQKSYWFYLLPISRIQPTFHVPPPAPTLSLVLITIFFLLDFCIYFLTPCFCLYPACAIPNKVATVIFLEHKSDYFTSLLKTTHGSHITLSKSQIKCINLLDPTNLAFSDFIFLY